MLMTFSMELAKLKFLASDRTLMILNQTVV